eukprot:833442_1
MLISIVYPDAELRTNMIQQKHAQHSKWVELPSRPFSRRIYHPTRLNNNEFLMADGWYDSERLYKFNTLAEQWTPITYSTLSSLKIRSFMSTSMVYDKQSKLFYVPVKDKDWREFNTLIVDSLVELDWHNNIISMTPIGRCRCPKMINVDDEIHIISWKKHIIVNKKTKSITQAHLKPNTKFSEKTLLWLPTKNCIVGVLNLEDQ